MSKVGDILEVTVSYEKGSGLDSIPLSFMGENFTNGEVKRFKLLDSYDLKDAICDCHVCKEWRRDAAQDECGTINGEIKTFKFLDSYDEINYDPKDKCKYVNPITKNTPLLNAHNPNIIGFNIAKENLLTFHMFLNDEIESFTTDNGVTIKWEVVEDDGTPYHSEKDITNMYRPIHT